MQTRAFNWETMLNLSHNKNRVERLSNDTYSVDYFDRANLNAAVFFGYSTASDGRLSIGQFYTWEMGWYKKEFRTYVLWRK